MNQQPHAEAHFTDEGHDQGVYQGEGDNGGQHDNKEEAGAAPGVLGREWARILDGQRPAGFKGVHGLVLGAMVLKQPADIFHH